MRPSKRTTILDAALRVVERDGVTAVTYESVAAEAGLTKGGLLYHFPSREALLHALHEHLATQWDTAMADVAGAPAEALTEDARLAAYAKVSTRSSSRAELLLILEASTDPETSTPWTEVLNRWTPAVPQGLPLSAEQTNRLIAYLAADGLWLFEALGGSMPDDVRAHLAEHLTRLTTPNR